MNYFKSIYETVKRNRTFCYIYTRFNSGLQKPKRGPKAFFNLYIKFVNKVIVNNSKMNRIEMQNDTIPLVSSGLMIFFRRRKFILTLPFSRNKQKYRLRVQRSGQNPRIVCSHLLLLLFQFLSIRLYRTTILMYLK